MWSSPADSLSTPAHRRLAIVGAGSSGLISLKLAIAELPDWEILVFEKSDSVFGRWGRPYPGFVSTSTKFTTQFASFPKYDASVNLDNVTGKDEFFQDGEYGDYLLAFAKEFKLLDRIRFRHQVQSLCWDAASKRWLLRIQADSEPPLPIREEAFDAMILCVGVHSEPKALGINCPTLSLSQLFEADGLQKIRNQTIVVLVEESLVSTMPIVWHILSSITESICRFDLEFGSVQGITRFEESHPIFCVTV